MTESDRLLISLLRERIEELEKRLNRLELISNHYNSRNRLRG